ncbi:MAG: DNA cytosine methyltransferase, partial [Verrucomicrobiae bacterium]|nr:DNA cytosine methyltransferase [Verrucomicrobiae bacterium]
MTEKPTQAIGIDLFSGAGGMSLGARQVGIDVALAVENCPRACETYRKNFPTTELFEGDIRKLKDLPEKPPGAFSILFGGPPCQGFSTSNQRNRNALNPNNWLFSEFVRILELWSPDFFVMENVKGIVETEGGRFIKLARVSCEKLGYKTSFGLLDAADFGVPQKRTRAFLVGTRDSIEIGLPTGAKLKKLTVRNAINDLPVLGNGSNVDLLPYGKKATSNYAKMLRNGLSEVTGNLVTVNAKYIIERYSHVPQGGNWKDIPAKLMKNYTDRTRCHTGIYRRLNSNEPSVVIGNFRKNMLIHPEHNRGLSVREAARLQSIPDEFSFYGSIGFQQQQVGNMVPPFLASTSRRKK